MFMADWFQKTVQNIGPIARYNEKEEQRRIEENKSTLDKVLDTAGDIAGGISNNYNWAKNTLGEYVPESIQKTIAPFGDMSPIGLLFSGLTGANEVEHAMQQTYAPTAAEYNYNAGKGAISGASGVVGGIADIFGAEGTGNELNAITKLNQRDKEYSGTDNILSLDYLTNPSGFIYDLGNMGGSMAALYPSSLLAAPARVTSAAQTIGRLPFLRGLSQGARETMLRGSLTSIPEGMSEGGNVVRQAKEEGLDNPFLRGWTTAALNVPALALSNGLEYGLLGGKLFRPGAGINEGIPERMVRGLYRAVPATAATSFQQGAEEYVQQGISNAQTDKDWGLLPWNASQDQIDALLVGAMTGAPMSGAASYGRSLTTREEERGVPKGVENPQAWKAAEIAANDVGRPDLAKSIYSQWALESGRFKETSGENNYGGLKDTNGNYRDYGSIEEFAHSYANDFLRHYDLSGVETPRDFVHVLKQNGYMEADENQYADNVESIASEIQGNGTASLHTYNLAVQPGIENQLDGLTPSFRNALPYIGGILDEMGMADGSAISSAYRTPEHNREVGGVEGSYHTKGDAVDIVLPDGITDEQAQAVKKRFEDTGAFEDVLFHDAGSGYHLHLEGYKGGLGRAGKTDTATSNVNYDNALMDFADDMINNSDGETSNFFDDKTMTDANGNKTFRATPNNIRALEQRYPEAVRKIRDYVQNGTNNQTALINNNTTRTGASGSTDNTNTINIETPSLDRLREFARRKVKTSRNPEEINNLQALFKNRNEDSGEFSNNQRAQEYLMKNYVNELQRNGTTAQGSNAQQNAPKPTNNTVNPQNNNNQSQQTSPIAQIAEQARQQERQSNELLTRINNNVNQPAYGVINGQQPSQDNFAQDIFANLIRQQQQADEQARRQAEIERQYSQIKGGLNATENPATTGTQATAPINQQRLQEVSNDVKRYVKARDEFSRQENINKLARNINSLFNGDYTMPNDGADESRYSLRKLSEAINKEKRRNEIYNSLTPEEQEFMNWLDVVYDNTGKLFKDIYENVLDERTQKINDYKEILRSQMKQGVTPRSVAYNRDTGEYTNLPGFSNNYQWYRDMTANGTRRISKKELEENLEYIAIDHLSNGYVDPQYGVQVPPEAVEDFKQTEDAINGLQEIAGKAQRYEEGRSLSRVSETGRTESQRNIQQTQTETTAAIRRDAIHYGRKLHDRLRKAKEGGEIQNPTSVNLEKLEKDINSNNAAKQKKAIEFMENKLDETLPNEEKAALKEEIVNAITSQPETNTTQVNTELEQNVSDASEKQQETANAKETNTEQNGNETENKSSLSAQEEQQEETTQENKPTTLNKTEQKKEENVSTENKQRSPSDIQREAYSKAYDKITNAHNQFERSLLTRDEAVRLMNDALTDFRNSAYIIDARRDEQLSRYIDSLTHDMNEANNSENAVEKTSEKTDNEGNNTNKEANNNGIYDEEQNRRRDTSNGREQSRGTGENEEEWGPSQADTREDRSAGQSARRPDADTDAGLSSNGRLSGTEQTENGSRNDSVGNDERKVEPLTSETVEKVSTQPALVNYRMSDSDNVGEGGKDTRYKNNIKAIKLLKQLEVEGRKATPTEQKVLAKYSGWGGLTSAFSDEKTNNELKELLSDEEYNAAKSSILSAYYTAPNVVKAIWKIADKLGFKGGRVLEPSMGVGNFFGLMPNKIMNNSNLTGVELDKISGQIATQLYQKANINIIGFENLTAPDNFFDLAIGNVPFGQFGVHDPKFNKYKFDIHNYFFAKALDKVRPGGIVMFITTKGTMDNAGSSRRLRTYLSGKADLIGAIRLPDTAFRGNTGTNVISDIIVLKKRTDPTKADIHAKQWYDIEAKEIDGSIFYLNEYYINHPEMIAGELTSSIGRFSNRSINVSGKDIDLTKKLNEVIKNIPKDVYAPLNNPVKDSKQATMEYFAPNTIRDNSYTIGKAGTIYQNINGKLEEVPKSKQGVVRDFVNVKRKFKQLLSAQVDNKISDAAISKIRKDLNDVYDTFVKNNGYINDKKNVRALSDDPEYGMVSAIERYNEDKKTKKVTAEKSDIFKKRTVGLIEKPTKAESPSDALAISLRENGKVDIDYMANLIGKDKQEVVDNLKGVIYKEPMTGEFQTADEYLSGNVREKLVQAKEIAKTDSSYKNNVEALEKIQPVDLVPEEVTVNLGASWVPASDIEDFANNLLDMNGDYIEVEYLPANGEWVVKANDYVRKGVTFTETWGVGSRWPFDKLLEAALNQRSPKVMKSVGEKKSVVDNEATAAVNNMIDNIKKAFKDWIWTDDKRTKRLLDYYNTNFNNWKLREYDGSHLTLPGYSLVAPKLRKHQKDAVWRIMQNSNTLLAHSVGAGKTWTMQTAAMEMRRLGICKKPMFVIPGHMIQQFSNEFRQIYPSAQLLIVSAENLPEVTGKDKGMKKAQKLAQRQRLLTQIATEDWDGIIISHDMFKRIPMSPEATNGFYQEQADILEQAIREINAKESKSNVDTMALRNLQKSRINLINKLQRDVAEEKKDMVIPFEELGIDQIFVDEADLFKNLAFTTKLTRVAGLSNTGSQRSMDMYLKTRYITKSNGGRGVVFATGTPISNTLAEMYTMMRYLDEDNLRNNNLLYFDNWANQFVNITQTVERNPDGNGYRAVNKASAFVNRPEMVKMFRKFADVKRPEDLKLKVPKMKTGKRIVVSVEPSETLRDFITQDVKERAEKIRKRQVDPTEDNMLKLTGELRKASLDVRLINPNVSASQAGTKIAALTDNVYQEYKDSTATKGAQLIFCDLSTPAGISDKKTDTDLDTDNEADISNGNFNVYQEIKRQLIEKGIKQNEIAFIHDAKTREKKQQLFDAVNNGEIRVLIGSTEKMGAGTNCQKKLVALHHLDCPWRPRDIEQREGRILRQGNENTEVGVYTYVTKDSFDANMWEKIKNKQHFITEALSADTSQRTIEDNDVLAMSFAEAEAIASGNPLMAEKVLTDAEVNKYMALKNAFDKKQARIRREVEQLPGKIASAKEIAKKAGMDAKAHKNISGDKFVMKIGNRTFTDRKKAQMALNKITEPIEKEQKTANVKIGEVAGFDLKARFMQTSTTLFGNKTKTSGEVILTLVNNWSYEAKNSVRSIEATANNMPQKIAETNEEFVRQATERQKALNKELGKKFADEDKLNELLKKQADIDRQLNLQYTPDNQEDIVETIIDNADNEYEVNPETGEVMNYQPQQEESAPVSNKKSDNNFLKEHVIVAGISQKDMDSVGNAMAKAVSKDDKSSNEINIDDMDFSSENPITYNDVTHMSNDEKENIEDLKTTYNSYFGKDTKTKATSGLMRSAVLRIRNRLLMIPEVRNSPPWFTRDSERELKDNLQKYMVPVIKTLVRDDKTRIVIYNGLNTIINDDKARARKNKGDEFDKNPNSTIDKITDTILRGVQHELQKSQEEEKQIRREEELAKQEKPEGLEGFGLDDYVHTKDNTTLKRVTLTKSFDRDEYNKLKALAKQAKGYYSRYAKGFLFDTEDDRNNFLHAVRGMNSDNAQYSFEEDMRKKLENYDDLRETAVMLEDNELTDREKEISEIGKRLGTPVMWFKAAPGFRGWHSNGITYLNKNGNWSHPKVFWHEVFHWIRNNNPKLFADMVNYIQTRAPFTGKQLDDYATTIHNGQNMTDAELVEEMMADNMVYVTRRVKFLRDLGKINHSLVKRFVYAIRDLMNRFIDFLNNPRAGLTNKQKKLMITAFMNTAMSIKDQKGNNIFKKGSDGEIVIDDNRDLYSMSKDEEDMLKEIYGEDLSDLFNDDDDYSARFSADNDKSIDSGTGTFKGAFRNIKQRFTRRNNDKRIKVYNKSARDAKIDKLGNIGGFEAILASPSRLAEKYPAFKPVLTYAENAMRRLLKNRNYYNKKLNEAYDYLEDKEKDLQELNDLMFKGDAVSTEYGKGIEDFEERAKAIVEETGVKEGTAKAYIAIRKLLDECYNIVNRARTQVQIKSETISKSQLEGLKQNKFVTILNEVQSETKEDDVLVTYEIRPSRIKKDIVTKQQLEELRKNEAIQIMEEREGVKEKDGSEYVYGNDYSTPKGEKINLENNKLYTVKYREAIPKVNKLEGYIPHFFHDFFVVVQNEDGTTTTVDSGHNVKEAYQKAEQYLKDNKDAKLIIRPKRFDFQEVGIDEEYYAEMVGDGAYQKINERIADEFDMTIDEAKKLLDNKNKKMPKPKRSSRHRFWGNIQHRTGAKGYESQDLDWVLRHYFNSACRYEALETEFKPKAIGYFERIYGRFDTDNKKLSGTARYIKDYINDVNGNPSAMEVAISTWLNNRRLFRYMFTSRYGERAALSVAAGITNKMSIAKLGVWNVSSALLNLTQLLNTTALLTRKNPVKAAWEIARACKDIAALTEKQSVKRVENLKPDERKALEDSGVFDELGLDSGAGYSKISFGKWANRSMVLFKSAERLARYATVLAAYRMGRNELNKNHDDAVEYAREINRKANFDYGVNDAPNLFRRGSILSQILFQFYKYPIKQFELMREFMPFNGKKDTTWQQKATFWGGWIFFAGAFGLPAEDLLWSIISLISEPIFGVSPKQAVRQFLLEASKDANLPERIAIRTLMYGGLSNFGIDISTRVGMADVIPGLGEDYNKDANPIIKAAEKFGGVTGGTIAQFYNSATKGDNMGMLRAISPGAYNIYTAAIGESTDGRGRITTKYDDALSRIIRGMGFKSTTEAVESEALSLKYYNMDKTAKEKQSAVDDYLDAEEEGKPLAPYARRLKELGVKKSTVKKARENRKKDRMQRGFEKDVPDYAKGAMNL